MKLQNQILNLEGLREPDIREEVLAPLIAALGYRSNTEHNVSREHTLRYSAFYLGHKKQGKDLELVGRADYLLQAGGRVVWVIEAKPPGKRICEDDIEQAYTYAAHPEVRAVYFVLCNGYEFQVFQTNRGPTVRPLLTLGQEQLHSEDGLQILRNLLAPDSVLRDHPNQTIDVGLPLGPSLRSACRITGGLIEYDTLVPTTPSATELSISVVGGAIQRSQDGALLASIESRSPVRTVEAFLKKCGLTGFEAKSESKVLSIDPAIPTVFRTVTSRTFPGGSKFPDVTNAKEFTLPSACFIEVQFKAKMVLRDGTLEGPVSMHARLNRKPFLRAIGNISLELS